MKIATDMVRSSKCTLLIRGVYESLGLPLVFNEDDVFCCVERGPTMVGAVCINPSSGFSYNLFDDKLDELKEYKLAYVSKLAANGLNRNEMSELVHGGMDVARFLGRNYLVSAVTPIHAAFWCKHYHFDKLSETRTLEEYNKELILIGKDL
jgi:hypothetical protein